MSDETTTEAPLPVSYELPEIEGVKPVGTVTRLNGSGQRITRPMHYGERGVLVVEYEVTGFGHTKTNDGPKRAHTLAVLDLYELPGKPGKALLRSLRQAHNLADSQRTGSVPALAGIADSVDASGGIQVTAENGVVLTDVELAERRGEILPGLPHVDVAVLVFEDESRALWPDDFADATGPHPEAGERIRKPGSKAKAKDDPVLIRLVLDADTGETLEEWTEEQEDARLREEEELALAEEARQDREAVDELERGRERHNIVERLLYSDGAARSIGSVKGNLAEIDDPKVIELALKRERGDKARAGMIAELEARLTALGKGADE